MIVSASYPLGYTEHEARRLADQATLLEDLTEDVLRRAGISAGMHVLDLGCGVGDLSLLAARLVGAAGAVLGIDQNASSVALARARAAALGARNVHFEATELDAFDSVQTFDAVKGRLTLLYLPNPAASLRRLRRFLKRSGIIAFQEMDMEPVSEVPASELFNRVRGWVLDAFTAAGAELNMGSRMLSVFLGAGLPRPTMIASGRVESGPDSQPYDYVVRVLRSLLPVLQRAGLAAADEVAIETLVDRLRQDAVLHERVIFLPRMVGAWTRLA